MCQYLKYNAKIVNIFIYYYVYIVLIIFIITLFCKSIALILFIITLFCKRKKKQNWRFQNYPIIKDDVDGCLTKGKTL